MANFNPVPISLLMDSNPDLPFKNSAFHENLSS